MMWKIVVVFFFLNFDRWRGIILLSVSNFLIFFVNKGTHDFDSNYD